MKKGEVLLPTFSSDVTVLVKASQEPSRMTKSSRGGKPGDISGDNGCDASRWPCGWPSQQGRQLHRYDTLWQWLSSSPSPISQDKKPFLESYGVENLIFEEQLA
ncbi:hypothetical protein Anapl_09758 [Anas platyrhynchos]|uniref:Uncharacterized protein n=1 Tax=Anas platyrhynchos TaxID=8839 RepID=R0LN53_ANAPL|nr:hypothetical protein Anapl_09758 [Anas platyrhynchos]